MICKYKVYWRKKLIDDGSLKLILKHWTISSLCDRLKIIEDKVYIFIIHDKYCKHRSHYRFVTSQTIYSSNLKEILVFNPYYFLPTFLEVEDS